MLKNKYISFQKGSAGTYRNRKIPKVFLSLLKRTGVFSETMAALAIKEK